MIEDPGVKRLLTSYPLHTLEVFAPKLKSWGPPIDTQTVGQEILAIPGGKGGFLDVALRFTWPDREAIAVLVEHWSEARRAFG